MSDESLRKAREELCKQFMGYVESLAKGFHRAQTDEDIDGVIRLRKAIDALDQAIAKGWALEPSSESRPPESRTWVEAVNEDEPPGG
jgi:hypothetical protein